MKRLNKTKLTLIYNALSSYIKFEQNQIDKLRDNKPKYDMPYNPSEKIYQIQKCVEHQQLAKEIQKEISEEIDKLTQYRLKDKLTKRRKPHE